VIAVGVARRAGDILVFEAYDAVKRERFHRPLGGGVEFGERSEDAVTRELLEETGFSATIDRRLGVLETLFWYEGERHHEVCFVYEVSFDDAAAYERDEFDFVERIDDADVAVRAIWVSPAELDAPLYPEGLAELLAGGVA
jgi:ADP-ribose pyrophosphatase YjhB (NUDIX family)